MMIPNKMTSLALTSLTLLFSACAPNQDPNQIPPVVGSTVSADSTPSTSGPPAPEEPSSPQTGLLNQILDLERRVALLKGKVQEKGENLSAEIKTDLNKVEGEVANLKNEYGSIMVRKDRTFDKINEMLGPKADALKEEVDQLEKSLQN